MQTRHRFVSKIYSNPKALGLVLICIQACCYQFTHAQNVNISPYSFLNVNPNARLAALGGVNVSLADRDVNFFFSNPALVSDSLHGVASASYQFYIADIGNAAFSYLHSFRKTGVWAFGVQHLNYGTITSYDETGFALGDFNASSSALTLSKSHEINHFRLGANLKTAFSNIAGFRSSALLLDVGGTFIHPEKKFTVGMVFKNIGLVMSEYASTSDTSLPFDVQLGITFKPEHMPFRFSLTAYHLTSVGDLYEADRDVSAAGKVLGHINLATEILFHRNVNVLLGYNFLRHEELKLEEAGGAAGISFGFAARIKSFEFVFSRSTYVVGNAGYGFTLSADIGKIITR